MAPSGRTEPSLAIEGSPFRSRMARATALRRFFEALLAVARLRAGERFDARAES